MRLSTRGTGTFNDADLNLHLLALRFGTAPHDPPALCEPDDAESLTFISEHFVLQIPLQSAGFSAAKLYPLGFAFPLNTS